ncbi:U3 [Hyposoter didymator ichnovirus]|nr:U3 [Hyposoter didymator ichnovirus]
MALRTWVLRSGRCANNCRLRPFCLIRKPRIFITTEPQYSFSIHGLLSASEIMRKYVSARCYIYIYTSPSVVTVKKYLRPPACRIALESVQRPQSKHRCTRLQYFFNVSSLFLTVFLF